MEKVSLLGKEKEDLKVLLPIKEAYRVQQIYQWIYAKGARSFYQMTSLPASLRDSLEETFSLQRPSFKNVQSSIDGTQKWLFSLEDKQEIEAVHIPEKKRGTLCISSQVGCTLTCKFCHTGTQTWVRNLEAGEIIGQVIAGRDVFNDWQSERENRHISNLVFMGMGEPFYNYENVAKALRILLDPEGMAFSRHKITVSTSGVIPFIEQCARDLKVNLAISLHAVHDDLRDKIMPLNKKYPLKDLLEVVRRYPEISKTDKVTFEYVMLKGVNDTPADARELLRLVRGIPAKINLIPFNTWPGSGFECSDGRSIKIFADILQRGGYISPLRTPRGEDILAACGQLKSQSERKSRSKLGLYQEK